MVFTLEEIRQYLLDQRKNNCSINDAIGNLSENNIVACIEDIASLNFERNKENLQKYEMKIGLYHLKEEQLTIRRNTNSKDGKYWMACSPRWIDKESKGRLNTEFDIAYWVNYGDDETYGLFTVEQIKQWLTTPGLKLHTIGGTRERIK